jgi:hypothetical protein
MICGRRVGASLVATALLACPTLGAAPARVDAAAVAQTRLVQLMRRNGALTPGLPIVHVAYICALQVEGRALHVIDIVQVVPRASATGGARRIALVSPTGVLLRRIDYAHERPLECRGKRLIVDGGLDPDADGREGNVITFGARGVTTAVDDIEPAELWPSKAARAGQR